MSTNSLITSAKWLNSASDQLRQQSIDSHYLDALIMLEDCIGVDRAQLLTSPEIKLRPDQIIKLNNNLKRRLRHEPLAYIRNRVEFYNRNFFVKNGVFIPRVETESFIDIIKPLNLVKNTRLADVGSGSGCIGITIKLELPGLSVDLLDTSDDALEISKYNSDKLSAKVRVINSNLLSSVSNKYDIIVANLPYVPLSVKINQDAGFEPPSAIFSGIDGLDDYRALFDQISSLKAHPSFVATETLASQHSSMEKLARTNGYNPVKTLGLVQLFSLAN